MKLDLLRFSSTIVLHKSKTNPSERNSLGRNDFLVRGVRETGRKATVTQPLFTAMVSRNAQHVNPWTVTAIIHICAPGREWECLCVRMVHCNSPASHPKRVTASRLMFPVQAPDPPPPWPGQSTYRRRMNELWLSWSCGLAHVPKSRAPISWEHD